jgi:putative spermidine/putrescine transport system permease protein
VASAVTLTAAAKLKPTRAAWPAVAFLFVFFVLPVGVLMLRSVSDPTWGLQNFSELLAGGTYVRVLSNTFLVAGTVTLASLLIGYPLAWLIAILPAGWQRLLLAILFMSMWTSLLARTYAWLVLLQRTGLINRMLLALGIIDTPLALVNNLTGVVIGMTYIMLPFVVLPLQATLSAIDPALMHAGAICGASPFRLFRSVLLPLSLPGIGAAGLMVFVMSLGYYVTPALLGGTQNMMLAELIAQTVQSLLNWGLGAAAAAILLAVTLALYAVHTRTLEREGR